MKAYRYKGYSFGPTRTMTEVHRTNGWNVWKELRPVYKIDDLKENIAIHPRLTSVKECKEYINKHEKRGE